MHKILLERFTQQKFAYGCKHGIDVHVYDGLPDPSVHPSWYKIKAIQQCMALYDWVFYMDADAMFCDMEINLLDYIQNYKNCDWLCTKHSGKGIYQLGCFFVKSTSDNKIIMETIWNARVNVDDNRYEEVPFNNLCKKGVVKNVKSIDDRSPKSFNLNYRDDYTPTDSDFILHFCEMKSLPKMVMLYNEYTSST